MSTSTINFQFFSDGVKDKVQMPFVANSIQGFTVKDTTGAPVVGVYTLSLPDPTQLQIFPKPPASFTFTVACVYTETTGGATSDAGPDYTAMGDVGAFINVPLGYQKLGAGPSIGAGNVVLPAVMQNCQGSAVFLDNKFYIAVCGCDSSGNIVAGAGYLYCYDGLTLYSLGAIPLANGYAKYGLALLPSGNIIVTQSKQNDGINYPVYRYNINGSLATAGTWTALGYPIDQQLAACCLVTLPDGRVMILGGSSNGALMSKTYFYTEGVGFSAGPDLPFASAGALAAVTPDGLVYYASGYSTTSACTINPTTLEIINRPSTPQVLNSGACVIDGGALYSVGSVNTTTVFSMDLSTYVWTATGVPTQVRGPYPIIVRGDAYILAGLGGLITATRFLQFNFGAFNVPVAPILTYYAKKVT